MTSRRISSGLFHDPKMRNVGPLAKLLVVYLLGDSPTGLARRSIRQMRIDVDSDGDPELHDAAVERALEQLVSVGVVKWDRERELLWVVNGLSHQAPKPDRNLGVHVINHMATLPASPLLDEFRRKYTDWLVGARVMDRPQLRLVDSGPEQDPERRIARAFEQAQPGGNTPETTRGALTLYYENVATVEEIERVVQWWTENGRAKKVYLKDCFERFGKRAAWSMASVEALGREPASPKTASRKKGAATSIDDTRAAYDAHMGST